MRKHYASLCQLYSLTPRSASSNRKGAGTVNIIWTCQHLSPFRPLSILVLLTTRVDCICGFLTLPEQGQRDRHSVLARPCNEWPVTQSLSVYGTPTESRAVCILQVLQLDVFCCLSGCFCLCSSFFGKWDTFIWRRLYSVPVYAWGFTCMTDYWVILCGCSTLNSIIFFAFAECYRNADLLSSVTLLLWD